MPASEVTVPRRSGNEEGVQSKKEIVWVPPAPEGSTTYFTVLFTTPRTTPPPIPIQAGQDGMGTHLISRFELSNKETVWVVMHEESMSDVQKAALENHRALVAQRHVNSVNLLSHQQASFELSLMVLAKTKMTPDTIWTFLADFYKKKTRLASTASGRFYDALMILFISQLQG